VAIYILFAGYDYEGDDPLGWCQAESTEEAVAVLKAAVLPEGYYYDSVTLQRLDPNHTITLVKRLS
jgi:hypothetical protein